MKKTVWIAIIAVFLGTAAVVAFKRLSGDVASAGTEANAQNAESLQTKIDLIKKKETEEPADQGRPLEQLTVSEAELESYVLTHLQAKIPAKMDSFDVQLANGTVAADTQLTFSEKATGNPLIDSVMGGTHNFFIKGKLIAANREGKFELEEIRLNGIPVPRILIEALFDKYVKPVYPDADLKEPFELPWGIDAVTLTPGNAAITY